MVRFPQLLDKSCRVFKHQRGAGQFIPNHLTSQMQLLSLLSQKAHEFKTSLGYIICLVQPGPYSETLLQTNNANKKTKANE